MDLQKADDRSAPHVADASVTNSFDFCVACLCDIEFLNKIAWSPKNRIAFK